MEYFKIKNNKGFTLIETMVAVLILSIALAALLSLTASSTFNARYANNEITANYLLQEAADYIKNDRDSTVISSSFSTFKNKYGTGDSVCFNPKGCYFEPFDMSGTNQTVCPSSSCPVLNYDSNPGAKNFYTYRTGSGITASPFTRSVYMTQTGDEIDALIKVDWKNGNLARSRTLRISLLDWRK